MRAIPLQVISWKNKKYIYVSSKTTPDCIDKWGPIKKQTYLFRVNDMKHEGVSNV